LHLLGAFYTGLCKQAFIANKNYLQACSLMHMTYFSTNVASVKWASVIYENLGQDVTAGSTTPRLIDDGRQFNAGAVDISDQPSLLNIFANI
jgi:hypothetical protein